MFVVETELLMHVILFLILFVLFASAFPGFPSLKDRILNES